MGLLERVVEGRVVRPAERSIATLDEYAVAVSQAMAGYGYGIGVQESMNGQPAEKVLADFVSYASQLYASNGVVFACMAVRQLVFSAVRIQYQRLNKGRPTDLFGDLSLSIVETPWPGGTTQDLLSRMIQDADLAGNSYWTLQDGELIRLRPDWVDIILEPRPFRGGQLGYRKIGYLYSEGGYGVGEPVPLLPSEVMHFAPYPDPLATYRGMSWLTPVIREVRGDGAMSDHKLRFFENAATPNMIIKVDPSVKAEEFRRFKAAFEQGHTGARNAYKPAYLGGGADVTVVGTDLKSIDFKAVQGASETRIAAAAGVPPVIVGLSEGLQGSSLNAGNYGMSRRRLADATMHPLWQNAAGSMAPLLPVPAGARCWYDARDVPFLREDAADQAAIVKEQFLTMESGVRQGWEPDSVLEAVASGDLTVMKGKHSGLYSVQLQPAGTQQPAAPSAGTDEEDQ